jgi:hypothetical protein
MISGVSAEVRTQHRSNTSRGFPATSICSLMLFIRQLVIAVRTFLYGAATHNTSEAEIAPAFKPLAVNDSAKYFCYFYFIHYWHPLKIKHGTL